MENLEPKVLVAIKSCARDQHNGYNDNVRNTWLRDLKGANYCFVLGNGATRLHPDELILNCGDDYNSLPHKTHALCKWFVDQEYDYVFLCDTDTYVVPNSLLDNRPWSLDYFGHFNGEIGKPNVVYGCKYAWASGGAGYWLSKKSAQLIAEVNIDEYSMCPELRIPCEDLAVGQILGPRTGFIKAQHDPRFGRSYQGNYKVELTAHFCADSAGRAIPSDWMKNHYEANR